MPQLVPTLDDLALDPSRARGLPHSVKGDLLARCAAVIVALSAPPDDSAKAVGHTELASVPQPEANNERLLTVSDAAKILSYAKSYVYELLRKGELPAVRRKKYVRVRYSALLQFISRNERGVVDRTLSNMLSTNHERKRRKAPPLDTWTEADGSGGAARRASDDCQPVGARNRIDS